MIERKWYVTKGQREGLRASLRLVGQKALLMVDQK